MTELQHFGVKGMRWGVRKKRASGDQQSKKDKTESYTATTKTHRTGEKSFVLRNSRNRKIGNIDYETGKNSKGEKTAYVDWAYVKKKYRGSDASKQLFKQFAKELESQKITEVTATVLNPKIYSVMERMGYQAVSKKDSQTYKDSSDVVFRKRR